MISLLITRVCKTIKRSRRSPEIYELLEHAGYLSSTALSQRDAVVATIQNTMAAWEAGHPHVPGAELAKNIETGLNQRDYLSSKAKTSGQEMVQRGP